MAKTDAEATVARLLEPLRQRAVFAIAPLATLVACNDPEAAHPRQKTDFASAVTGAVARRSGDSSRPSLHPLKPMTSDVEVLQGDPDTPGKPFVIRIRELPGGIVPPHSHPVDEHITVVSGTWYFGLGDSFDREALKPLPTGSYAFAPKGSSMFGYAPDGATVQIHGVGPFHIRWRDGSTTLDGNAGAFRFRRGEGVQTPRGEGRIRQGYRSGAIIQYEIDGRPGLWMVDERDVRPL